MNFTSMYLWVTQKNSSQYEHFHYKIDNNEKNNFLVDVYVSSVLGGLRSWTRIKGQIKCKPTKLVSSVSSLQSLCSEKKLSIFILAENRLSHLKELPNLIPPISQRRSYQHKRQMCQHQGSWIRL
jgi:hypothetical protein